MDSEHDVTQGPQHSGDVPANSSAPPESKESLIEQRDAIQKELQEIQSAGRKDGLRSLGAMAGGAVLFILFGFLGHMVCAGFLVAAMAVGWGTLHAMFRDDHHLGSSALETTQRLNVVQDKLYLLGALPEAEAKAARQRRASTAYRLPIFLGVLSLVFWTLFVAQWSPTMEHVGWAVIAAPLSFLSIKYWVRGRQVRRGDGDTTGGVV